MTITVEIDPHSENLRRIADEENKLTAKLRHDLREAAKHITHLQKENVRLRNIVEEPK